MGFAGALPILRIAHPVLERIWVGWVEAIAETHHSQSAMRWVLPSFYSFYTLDKAVFGRCLFPLKIAVDFGTKT